MARRGQGCTRTLPLLIKGWFGYWDGAPMRTHPPSTRYGHIDNVPWFVRDIGRTCAERHVGTDAGPSQWLSPHARSSVRGSRGRLDSGRRSTDATSGPATISVYLTIDMTKISMSSPRSIPRVAETPTSGGDRGSRSVREQRRVRSTCASACHGASRRGRASSAGIQAHQEDEDAVGLYMVELPCRELPFSRLGCITVPWMK